MNYLLDTNACIALLNGAPEIVRARFEKANAAGSQIFVSSVGAYELWYGAEKSARPEQNSERLRMFFSGPISLLAFEEDDARVAEQVRVELEKFGRPIGAYDLLIAGQAIANGLTLVTANVREFGRVAGLSWEDWAKKP